MINSTRRPRFGAPIRTSALLSVGFLFCQPDAALAQTSWSGGILSRAAEAIGAHSRTPQRPVSIQSKSGAKSSVTIQSITAGQIPKFTNGTGGLDDSVITQSSGNIGIGMSNPSQQLHIHSVGTWAGTRITTAATGLTINDGVNFGYDNDYGAYVWNREATPVIVSTNNTERMRIDAVGNVGIGTINPVRLLHIGANNSVGGIRVEGPLGVGTGLFSFSMGGVGSFGIDAPTIVGGRFIVKEDGKVGIGTALPSTALHVVGDLTLTGTGNISATGNIAAKYQDLAEWVPARRAIPAGTVVVLDVEQSNHVLPSTHAYDTSVAGVVSAKPGVLLGEGGEGKVMVATTGRVRVRVDATNGPIRVGDLLVTSDKQGIAMRSMPLDLGGTPIHRPGTLIGKALEPLDKGIGEILVLLSLQ